MLYPAIWDLYSVTWDLYSTVWDLHLAVWSLFKKIIYIQETKFGCNKTYTQRHLTERKI